MNSLNSINGIGVVSTPITKKRTVTNLEEKALVRLGEPRPRPRKPLTKFTTTSPNPNLSDSHLIPAYRTTARESLPIVTKEEKKKLNISPTTGVLENSSSLRARHRLLKRKTIHSSLEDLRYTKNLSCESRKSIPLPSRDTHQYQVRYHDGSRSVTRVPASGNSQRVNENLLWRHSTVQTDAIIDADKDGGSGDKRNSFIDDDDNISNQNTFQSSRNIAQNNVEEEDNLANLSAENDLLKRKIEKERRKSIFYQIISTFVFTALRARSQRLDEIDELVQQKRVECAARMILHHLLLNSWKMTKGQVAAISTENAQLHKTIDNQSLQLTIVRKMQSMEKEKTSTVFKEYEKIKRNYGGTIKENETLKEEYSNVLEEKSSLEWSLKSLSDENTRLNTDLRIRLEKKEMQVRSMELDRMRAEKFSRENEDLAKEANISKSQIKELASQKKHWQEKAMEWESKCYEQQLEMENREKAYEKLLDEKKEVSKENEILALSKSKLEKAVDEAKVKLEESTTERKALQLSCNECKDQLEDLEDQVQYLQSTLRRYKRENAEIRQKLYDCTLKNVHKRRVWGAALYFIVSPFEAFKRFYFGTPEQSRERSSCGRSCSGMLDSDSKSSAI
ncbi:hypothetical protein Ocin01_01799 [Orchesella cincta]|uniref:Uncharacterized protein n=1 Tax=Orchesella cincta TaxID=48709 RepID=A0A1D2NIH9_ORCCI|nr:hypothetical protein Ocin01_01799 [Orchesella cincta]